MCVIYERTAREKARNFSVDFVDTLIKSVLFHKMRSCWQMFINIFFSLTLQWQIYVLSFEKEEVY